MPWKSNGGPSEHQKCHSCNTRYWQSAKTRLCRQCEKELNEVVALEIAGKSARSERTEAIQRATEILAEPRPFVEVVYGGLEFLLVWDGSFKYENPTQAALRFGVDARGGVRLVRGLGSGDAG